ncbi:ATP-binding protein [Sinimarinibacterium flocculans]|uniref:Phage DNA replication protein (Predicted replicative helicase loader) n=1 Tax=Sinimarinibacterium flocculans TaxID=985250 RepID=A0A318E3U6_9GAMM|nr:ATP-binding protein [Sinimarinibacterium flocculans]PXV65818.1 phage DNA replication protein (predicted replicative helicase loader) [Sinimarinibacterium flocculans]
MAAFSLFAASRGEYPERQGHRVCPTHGDFSVREFLGERGEVIGVLRESCPECEAERAKEREQRDLAEKIRAGTATAKIPPRFVHADLSSMQIDPDNRAAVAKVQDYAQLWPGQRRTGESLILLGPVGTGKTHAGIALLKHAITVGVSARYATVNEMLGDIRDTWSRRSGAETEKDVIRHFADVALLMLDEIGATAGTEHERAIVFDVLDRRYRNMRPTILAGNVTVAELGRVLDARAVDRLRETSRIVLFSGKSRRQREAA